MNEGTLSGTRKSNNPSVQGLWGMLLAEGIIMLVLGAIAIVLPPVAGITATMLLGWLLILAGLFGFFATLVGRHAPGFWWSLLSAVVTISVGGFLCTWPMGGVISLTLAISVFFLFDGLLSIAMALDHRRYFTPRWIWLAVNGVIDLVFAIVVVWWMPESAVWVVGLIIGIDMLICGATLIALAVDTRQSDAGRKLECGN